MAEEPSYELKAFLAALREEGVGIGIDREVKARMVLSALDRRSPPANALERAEWLATVLASNPREQELVRDMALRHAPTAEVAALVQARPELLSDGLAAHLRSELPGGIPAEGDAAPGAPGRRSWLTIGLVLGLAVILLGGLAAILVTFVMSGGSGVAAPDIQAGPAFGTTLSLPSLGTFLDWFTAARISILVGGIVAILLLVRVGHGVGLESGGDAGRRPAVGLARLTEMVDVGRSHLLPPGRLRRALRGLRRPGFPDRRQINLPATIRATARAGGRPQILFQERVPPPSYLVIAQRRTKHDQGALLADVLLRRLRAASLRLEAFRVGDYPGQLRPWFAGWTATAAEPLEAVLARMRSRRLVLIGDGTAWWDPLAGALRPAAGALQWPGTRILLTPVPRAAWGTREEGYRRAGFAVVEFTAGGVESLARLLEAPGEMGPGPAGAEPAGPGLRDIPEELAHRPFVMRAEAPEQRDRDWLMGTLSAWLGRPGMQLLAAVALHPEPGVGITARLAARLAPELAADSGAAGQLREAMVHRVTRLPWLRRGRFPDWLRADLIKRLEPGLRDGVADVYLGLLAGQAREVRAETAAEKEALFARVDAAAEGTRAMDATLRGFLREVVPEVPGQPSPPPAGWLAGWWPVLWGVALATICLAGWVGLVWVVAGVTGREVKDAAGPGMGLWEQPALALVMMGCVAVAARAGRVGWRWAAVLVSAGFALASLWSVTASVSVVAMAGLLGSAGAVAWRGDPLRGTGRAGVGAMGAIPAAVGVLGLAGLVALTMNRSPTLGGIQFLGDYWTGAPACVAMICWSALRLGQTQDGIPARHRMALVSLMTGAGLLAGGLFQGGTIFLASAVQPGLEIGFLVTFFLPDILMLGALIGARAVPGEMGNGPFVRRVWISLLGVVAAFMGLCLGLYSVNSLGRDFEDSLLAVVFCTLGCIRIWGLAGTKGTMRAPALMGPLLARVPVAILVIGLGTLNDWGGSAAIFLVCAWALDYPAIAWHLRHPATTWRDVGRGVWRWAVAAPLLFCAVRFTPLENLTLSIPLLALPYAAWLGHVWGRAALTPIGVFLAPMLVGYGFGPLGVGGGLGVYLAALLLARLAGDAELRARWRDADAPLGRGLKILLLGVLPLGLGISWAGFQISTGLSQLLVLLLVLLGFSAIPITRMWRGLALACFVGLVVMSLLRGMPELPFGVRVFYGLAGIADFVMACLALYGTRAIAGNLYWLPNTQDILIRLATIIRNTEGIVSVRLPGRALSIPLIPAWVGQEALQRTLSWIVLIVLAGAMLRPEFWVIDPTNNLLDGTRLVLSHNLVLVLLALGWGVLEPRKWFLLPAIFLLLRLPLAILFPEGLGDGEWFFVRDGMNGLSIFPTLLGFGFFGSRLVGYLRGDAPPPVRKAGFSAVLRASAEEARRAAVVMILALIPATYLLLSELAAVPNPSPQGVTTLSPTFPSGIPSAR